MEEETVSKQPLSEQPVEGDSRHLRGVHSSTSEVEEKPKKNWPKIIAFSLLGLVLLLGAFYVGYWYGVQKVVVKPPKPAIPTPTLTPLPTPTPTPPVENKTTDWQTYTNIEYGYSIKYPEKWKVVADNPQSVVISGNVSDPFYAPIAISANNNSQLLSIRDWFKENYLQAGSTASRFEDTNISGQPAVRWLDPMGVVHFFIAKSDKIYSISPVDIQENKENQNKMITLMLSTFKFLD